MTEFEKARDTAQLTWALNMAQKDLKVIPVELELRSVGRVPWEVSADWSRQWTRKHDLAVKGVVEASQPFAFKVDINQPYTNLMVHTIDVINLNKALTKYKEAIDG